MRSLCLIALSSGMFSLNAGIIASNTFDAGVESWSAVAADAGTAGYNLISNSPAVFQPAGGNPGGYAETDDLDTNDTLFAAPAAYLGNLLAAIGGSLAYDLLYNGTLDYNSNDIVIKGGGTVLTYNRAIPALSPTPGPRLRSRSLPARAGRITPPATRPPSPTSKRSSPTSPISGFSPNSPTASWKPPASTTSSSATPSPSLPLPFSWLPAWRCSPSARAAAKRCRTASHAGSCRP